MVKKKQFKHLTSRKQINYFLNFSARIMIYYLPVGRRGPFWYKPGPRHKFTPLGFAPVQFLVACSFCPSCTPLKQLSPPSYLPLVFTSSFTESVKKSPGSLFHREVAFSPILSKHGWRGGVRGEGCAARGGWGRGLLPR